MTRNPVLFPGLFSTSLSRLDVGSFGGEGATTGWVKQVIVEMFYGRGVPLFWFEESNVTWEDGFAYFDGVSHPLSKGSHSFAALDTGWHYIYAQDDGDESSVVVSGSPPNAATQQLWWNLRVENGAIAEVIPAKTGFGV